MIILRKAITVAILALTMFVKIFAQAPCSEEFSGQVRDENDQPLVNAAVTIQPSNAGALTDINGHFKFNRLCKGEYAVVIQYVGYKSVKFNFVLSTSSEKVIRLEAEIVNLEEVIVQDKVDQVEHAHNVSQLSQEQLAAAAGKSLGESLKEIPGVNTIQAGPGIFKPVIHGVHSQRILILNYGVRQEGQQWGAEHAPEIDPFIASNIIVVKDASSIKYGTDALGGVVIVNPASLPERTGLGGTINTIFQSNGRSGTISGMLEGGIKRHDGWGWRVQGTAKQSGDFNTPTYSLTNTGIKELNFSASTGYHGDHSGLEIFFSHFQTEIGVLKGTAISNLDDLEAAMEREPPQYTTKFSYKIHEPRQEVSHNLLKLNGHFQAGHGTLRFQYGFQNNDRKEFDIRRGSLSSIPAIDLQLNTHTIETEWESSKADKRTSCIGLTGMFQNNKNIPGTDRIPFIPNFTNASAGLFAITKWYLKKWTIDVGARYDYRHYSVKGYDFKNALYSSNLQFQNVSATAGGTVTLSRNRFFSTSLASAWRPPHVAELYSQGTHQSNASIEYGLLLNDTTNEVMNINDVSFKNEKALKWVSTFGKQWKRIEFEVSAFANYIFNYIYLQPKGVTKNIRGTYPYFRYTQTDAFFLGVDFSSEIKLHSSFSIKPKISLLRASDVRNNDYLVFIPTNRYGIDFRYVKPVLFLLKNLFVESKFNYVTKQQRAPRIITVQQFRESQEQQTDPLKGSSSNFDFMEAPDGYFLLGASTGCSVKQKKARYDFRVGAENILNTRYREYTNRFRYYADDVGRNFILSIKYIF